MSAADSGAGLCGLSGDRRRLLDRKNRVGREPQPRREWRRRPGHRGCTVHLDDRRAARTVRETPEALKREALGWLPLGEEGEIPLDRLFAVVDELPRHVKQHRAPPLEWTERPYMGAGRASFRGDYGTDGTSYFAWSSQIGRLRRRGELHGLVQHTPIHAGCGPGEAVQTTPGPHRGSLL